MAFPILPSTPASGPPWTGCADPASARSATRPVAPTKRVMHPPPPSPSPAVYAVVVEFDQPLDGLRHPPRRDLPREAAEARAVRPEAAAQQQVIDRDRATVDLADPALQADARHVVLAAAVGAAGDLDRQRARL